MQHLAAVAALRGKTRVAAQLCGFVDKTFRTEGTLRFPTEQRTYALLQATFCDSIAAGERERPSADGAARTHWQPVEIGLVVP